MAFALDVPSAQTSGQSAPPAEGKVSESATLQRGQSPILAQPRVEESARKRSSPNRELTSEPVQGAVMEEDRESLYVSEMGARRTSWLVSGEGSR
jgi:hypothetical protein